MVILLLVKALNKIFNQDILFAARNVPKVLSQLKNLLFRDGSAFDNDDILKLFFLFLGVFEFREKSAGVLDIIFEEASLHGRESEGIFFHAFIQRLMD